MRTRRRRYAGAVVALALVGVLAMTFGVAGAAKKGKVVFNESGSGPNVMKGSVKHKVSKCKKRVKITLKGPAPFDPSTISANDLVKIGTAKTNRKGKWKVNPPAGGFFIAGNYKATAKKKVIRKRAADPVAAGDRWFTCQFRGTPLTAM